MIPYVKSLKEFLILNRLANFVFFNANYMYLRFNELACYLYYMINHT